MSHEIIEEEIASLQESARFWNRAGDTLTEDPETAEVFYAKAQSEAEALVKLLSWFKTPPAPRIDYAAAVYAIHTSHKDDVIVLDTNGWLVWDSADGEVLSGA